MLQIRATQNTIAKEQQIADGLGAELSRRVESPESGWNKTHLVDIVEFPSGQVDPRVESYRSWVLIAPDHIESRTGRLLALRRADEQGAISGKYIVYKNDVVFSKIRPELRKAIRADQNALCSADMCPMRPSEGIDSRFLLRVLLADSFSRFAVAQATRSGIPKINRQELGEYYFHLPPISEQRRFAEIFEVIDYQIEQEEGNLKKLRLLKQGLMEDLLTGRVRVTRSGELTG